MVHEEDTYLKDFWPICSESGAVRALCVQHTFKSYGMLAPPLRSLIGSKFQRSRTRVLRPAQKRTPVTRNHCQRPWLRASRVYKQLSPLFMRSLELLSNLDLINQHWIYTWRKISYFYVSVKWNDYLSNFHKEILNLTRNRKNVSLWTCQHMFCDFIN